MKTKRIFMVLVALVIVTNVFATEKEKMSILPFENTKALVSVLNETPTANEVSISSENGKILFYKRSTRKVENYKQVFDLSRLEDGTYEFKVKAGSTTVKREMNIIDGNIQMQKPRKEIDPYFAYANNRVNISYLNFANENVTVKVFNKREMIFSADIGDEFKVNRALNLSNLETGDYDIMLANNNKKYWFSVTR